MLAPHFDAAAANQTLPMPDTPLKMLPPRNPPPVVQVRHSTKHNIQGNSECSTKRQLSVDRWLKTTSDKELGRLVKYEAIDENTFTTITNLFHLIVRIDGVIVDANAPELLGDQVVNYQI